MSHKITKQQAYKQSIILWFKLFVLSFFLLLSIGYAQKVQAQVKFNSISATSTGGVTDANGNFSAGINFSVQSLSNLDSILSVRLYESPQIAWSSTSYVDSIHVDPKNGNEVYTNPTRTGTLLTNLSAGVHQLYLSVSTYNGATVNSQTFTVTVTGAAKTAQTINFAALADRILLPSTFTVSATVNSGLAISFSSLTTNVCSVSGSTVSLLIAGQCTIAANQSGNASYSAAPQVTRSFTVNFVPQTISFAALGGRALGSGSFAVSATASSGLPVRFRATTTGVCNVSGNTVSLLSAGTCTILAYVDGSTTYAYAPEVSQSFTVSPAAQSISFAALNGRALDSGSFSVIATASSGFAVSFSSLTTGICSVSGSTVNLLATGTCTIAANQGGNASYSAAPQVAQSFTVSPAAQSISFAALSGRALGSGTFVVSATASSGLAVSFSSLTTGICSVSGSTVNLLATGTCTIAANQGGNASYSAAPQVAQSFIVSPAAQSISFAALSGRALGSGTFAVSATASSGLAVSFSSLTTGVCSISGNTVSLLATGTCTIAANQAGNGSYSAAPQVTQSFTIAAGSVIFTSVSVTNDGGVADANGHFSAGINYSVQAPFNADAIASVVLYEEPQAALNSKNYSDTLHADLNTGNEYYSNLRRTDTLSANLSVGVHQLYLGVTTYDGITAYSQRFSVTVTAFIAGNGGAGTSSPTPQAITVTPPHLNNPDAGSLPGTLNVSPNGAATYSLPLNVPPGTAGLQPNLSLDYNSQGSNGMLGLGWTLGGLSSIHRCGKTIAQDGVNGRISFDNADRLCLDGQRLVRIDGAAPGTTLSAIDTAYWAAGAVYRTEEENFIRISRQANGGFKAETKDGRIQYFGTDATNAIAAQGRTDGQTLLWALGRVQDRSGNYMLIEYNQDSNTGEFTPKQIRYGGNTANGQSPDLAVRFTYETRPDTQLLYTGGSRADIRTRLTHVTTYQAVDSNGTGGTFVGDYEVHYSQSSTTNRSLVDWVQASALNPNTNVVEYLPKTTFNWGQGSAPTPSTLPIPAFALPTFSNAAGARPPLQVRGDLDGSGKTSLIAAKLIGCGKVLEATCELYSDSYGVFNGELKIRLPNGQVIDTTINTGDANIPFDPTLGVTDVLVGDFDGDGRDDLILKSTAAGKWGYCLNRTTQDGNPAFSCFPGGTGVGVALNDISPIDLRNDRKLHVISRFDDAGNANDCYYNSSSPNGIQCDNLKLNGSAAFPTSVSGVRRYDYFNITPISLSKQGRTDFYSVWVVEVPAANPANPYGNGCPGGACSMPIDIVRGVSVCYNNQDGLNCIPLYQTRSVGSLDYVIQGVQGIGDFNGDGLTDFAFTVQDGTPSGTTYLCLSKENGSDCQINTSVAGYVDGNANGRGTSFSFSQTNDFTGDGIARTLFTYGPNLPDKTTARSELCRYTTAGFICDTFTYADGEYNSEPLYLDDSGVPAFLIKNGAMIDGKPALQPMTLAGNPAKDLLIRVTDGLQQSNEIDYTRGNDSAVFNRYAVINGVEQRPTYPKVAVQPGVLVKQVRRANGQGGWLSNAYRYEGALADATGRGFLGFAKTQVTDLQTQASTVANYNQNFPYIGKPIRVQQFAGNGVLLSDTQNQYNQKTASFTNGGQTLFGFVEQSTTIRKDLNGNDLGTTITSNQYNDGWGNLTQQTVSVTGAGATFTGQSTTTYKNDSTAWLLGLPESITTSRTDPITGSIIRHIANTYDTGTGLLKQTIVEPNTALQVSTDFDRSGNVFGLVNKTTQTWTDPSTSQSTSRTTADVTYDTKGRFVSTRRNALGQSESRSYYPGTGVQSSLTDPNGLTTTWTADGFGRINTELRPDGNQIRQYRKQCQGDCPAGAVMVNISDSFHGTDRISVPSLTYIDSVGHTLRSQSYGFDGRAIVTDSRYDSWGRLSETDQPHYQNDSAYLASRQTYDELNRVIRVDTNSDNGSLISSSTNYQGYTTITTNPKGQQRTDTRDVLGRVTRVQDSNGGLTQFSYDAFGNLITTIDPNGNRIRVQYDNLGRKTQLNDPDLGQIQYFVDPVGRTWKQISPNQAAAGQATLNSYDLLDRQTARYEPDLESHWLYNNSAIPGTASLGQLAESYTGNASNKDYRRLHSYDNLGRLSSTTQVLSDASYSVQNNYDAWGRLITQSYQRGNGTAKVYDSRYNDKGYLSRIERGNLILWQATAQDAANRLLQSQLGNGLQQNRSYSPYTGRLSNSQLQTAGQNNRLQEAYQYDALGNVSQRSHYWDNTGFQESYQYDSLNRLTSSQVLGQTAQSFSYDPAGNLLSKTGVGTGNYSYPAQGASAVRPHAITSIPGIGSFAYDANGNQTSGANKTTTWTSYDLPIQISKGTVSSTFVYGPEHQRTRQTKNDGSNLIYAGAQEVETSSTGQVTLKTYWPNGLGVEIDRPGSATELNWTHADHLGSPVAISDASGTLKERLAFDSWGKRRTIDGLPINGTATPDSLDGQTDNKGYTGHEMLDQLDLVHMNGRVYDPLTGRFLSGDPLIQDPINGQNYNRYSYVFNNPLNFTDPTGFEGVAQTVTITAQRPKSYAELFSSQIPNIIRFAGSIGTGGSLRASALPVARFVLPKLVTLRYATGVGLALKVGTVIGTDYYADHSDFIQGLFSDPSPKTAAIVISISDSINSILNSINGDAGNDSGEALSDGAKAGEGTNSGDGKTAPSLPDKIVGDQSDPRAGPNKGGGKHTSGPLTPENGGVGDFEADLNTLTGGYRPRQPGDKAPPGSLVGPNGIFGRPENSGGGKSIDIPGNGNKPHETLHYP